MSKIYFHAEVVEGVTRVQTGPFGQVLQHDAAGCMATTVIALANSGSADLGRVLLDWPALRVEDLERLENLEVRVGPNAGGAIARALGFGSRRVEIVGIPLDRLAEVLELCWQHAPLLFGVPANPSHAKGEPPDLSRTVTPSVEYLRQWRSLGAVFYHGEWVAFSAGHLPQAELLETVMTCFRDADWQCVVSPEPM